VQAHQARPRRRTRTLLWTGQILLAALFVSAAIPKLAGAHSAISRIHAEQPVALQPGHK
jgi:hypothetical protein